MHEHHTNPRTVLRPSDAAPLLDDDAVQLAMASSDPEHARWIQQNYGCRARRRGWQPALTTAEVPTVPTLREGRGLPSTFGEGRASQTEAAALAEVSLVCAWPKLVLVDTGHHTKPSPSADDQDERAVRRDRASLFGARRLRA